MRGTPPGSIRIISGKLRGRKVPVLSMKGLRPTPDRVRETLFNWLQTSIQGATCYNFFAGTGILGFEALSRGAKHCVMVDQSRAICESLHKVRDGLGIEAAACEIVQQDVLEYLKVSKPMPSADLIFLDPPFDTDLLEQSLKLLEASPLCGVNTKIYTELPLKAPIPEIKDFAVAKTQKAGQVAYHLFTRKS